MTKEKYTFTRSDGSECEVEIKNTKKKDEKKKTSKELFKELWGDIKKGAYDVSIDTLSKVLVLIVENKIGWMFSSEIEIEVEQPIFSCPNIKCCQCQYNSQSCKYKNH